MNTKKLLISLFAGVVGATVLTVSSMAQTNTDIFEVGKDKTYETWSSAVAAAADTDNDGVITYHIYGKLSEKMFSVGGAETINIVGMNDEAELNITASGAEASVIYLPSVVNTVNYSNITLSRPDGAWIANNAHHNCFFSVWGDVSSLITYTNCVFPNGSGNNQFGKTTYTNCKFYNDTYYALWIYDSVEDGTAVPAETVVTNCCFDAVRGIKIYSENATGKASAKTTIDNCSFAVENKPAIVSSLDGTITITDVDASECKYGLLATEYLNGNSNFTLAEVTVDGKAPEYVATVNGALYTDIDYAEAEAKGNPVEAIATVIDGKSYTLAQAVALDGVTEIDLIRDVELTETVVINKDITINGNGYTVKGADVTETETNGTAVTPITINGAEVTLINITVKGGNAYNNDPYQPTASHGVAGAAVNVTNGKVTIDNSTLAGGDAGAEYTKSTGSAIVATDSDIIVTNSTLATGRTTRRNVIGVATVYLDDDSTIDLTDVVLDTAKSTYASDNVIASFNANGVDTTEYTGKVKLDGEILIRGTRLANVNIVAGENLTFKGNIDPSYISDTLYIQFDKKDIDDAGEDNDEEADLYDIVVYGNKNYINRLNSADLTFILESDTSVKPVYEILPVNPVKITTDADYENRYMFSFDGVTQPDDTAKSIVIGQVKISGYGAYTFKVNGAVDENIVNASETADSIVEHFYVGGKADGKGELDLTTDVDDNGSLTPVINAEIIVPTRDLEIVIDFPNAVAKNAAAYQDMTVTVAGGDLDDAVIIKLGNEAVETKIATEYEKKDAKFTVDVSADNKYTVKVVDILTVNTSYTVTVEGAGYRTARYTVTMNCEESKTLNFWNNVKDNKVEVEEDKASSAKKVTFLAGDIVKDSVINIYDLSAVVSYFGEIDLDEDNKPEYAKYDLNRDGKIDSKDVAYVLVSWNN